MYHQTCHPRAGCALLNPRQNQYITHVSNTCGVEDLVVGDDNLLISRYGSFTVSFNLDSTLTDADMPPGIAQSSSESTNLRQNQVTHVGITCGVEDLVVGDANGHFGLESNSGLRATPAQSTTTLNP